MSDNDDRLDRLLCAPLPTVADGGFSARVMARIGASSKRRWWLDEFLVLSAAGLVLAVVASTEFPGWIAGLGYSLATSLPLATAALVLVVTLTLARPVAE